MRAALIAVVALVICGAAGVAHAYPQFQLGKEPTCTACHIAPAGGGLLNPMGEETAGDIATREGDPSFLHGKYTPPDWLALGGDVRAAAGFSDNGKPNPAGFPMQLEGYAAASHDGFTGYVTLGVGMPNPDNPVSALLLREHWVMYRSAEGSESGFYVRAGRFMPVYGLRLAEHPVYTRRFGGTPLYGETYGVSAGWLSAGAEVHLTGFVHDPIRDAIETGDGAALYAEKRVTDTFSLGVEGRYATSDTETRTQGGVTGKLWLEGPEVQLSGEVQVVHQTIDPDASRNQLVGYLMGSWAVRHGFLLDVGIGHYDENLAIKNLDRDALDVNLHWFFHSHVEFLLTNRVALIGLGSGGDTSGYSLLQLHYRI